MNTTAHAAFLLGHGYSVLLVVVLLEQLGAPLPGAPVLLAAGALAGGGQLDFLRALLAVTVGCALSDVFWFELGRRQGIKVVRHICRISLEPDSCVRRTEELFERRGPNALLVAKFLPGLNSVASPLAGVFGMTRPRFYTLATAGALLWGVTWMSVGWVFRDQLDLAVRYASRTGARLGLVLALAFAAWLAYKWDQRRRFLRKLVVARVTPQELKSLIDAGADIAVVDLRGKLDFESDPVIIPGALRIDPQELEDSDPKEIPREREIVLYCT